MMDYEYTNPGWLPESQDFTLGAKTTSCLHPGTGVTDESFNSAEFELPEWMESRENLGLSNIDLFDVSFDTDLSMKDGKSFINNDYYGYQEAENEIGMKIEESRDITDEDYQVAINPEDMLVPLQPACIPTAPLPSSNPSFTPKASPICIDMAPTPSPSPKVTICIKKVAIPTSKKPKREKSMIQSQPISKMVVVPPQTMSVFRDKSETEVSPVPVPSVSEEYFNPHDLLDELVQMVGNEEPKDFNPCTPWVAEDLDHLLSQLETSKPHQETSHIPQEAAGFVLDPSDVSSWGSEPASPVSLPSPVPSYGSLSPHSAHEVSLHSGASLQPYSGEPSSLGNGVSFASLLSPRSVASSSQTTEDLEQAMSPASADESDVLYIPSDDSHSYCRSPQKVRRGSRKGATPKVRLENRKERKKEQNKRAALRYRQKKRKEDDVMMDQIRVEEERQKELKAKYTGLKQELTFLKKMMREVFIAKGVVPADAFKKKVAK